MIISYQASIDIRLSKRFTDIQRDTAQPQDPVHGDCVQRINQFGR